MFSYRLRGIVNLQIVGSAFCATGYFFVLALAVPYLPRMALSPRVNLLFYSVPILLGMVLSGKYWQSKAYKFHSITWIDSATISTRQIVTVALLIFGLIVATKDREISRLVVAFYLVSCSLLLLVVNKILPGYLSRIAFQNSHKIRAVFVGNSSTNSLSSWVKQKEHLGIEIIGFVSDQPLKMNASDDLQWLGVINNLGKIIEDRAIGQIILIDLPGDPEQIMHFVETCQNTGCRLLIHQNFWDRLPVAMVPIVEGRHFFLTLHDEPLEDPLNRGLKRLFDLTLALPVVIFIIPPLALVVAAVQLVQAPGPLLFARKRGGHRRRDFAMLKFRSMYFTGEDQQLEAQQATKGDKRIYPFGAFLRRTSLDEFPQFWNVLVGDMSIVGPRPHLTQHDSEFSQVAKAYRTRQLVKPGLTGLAQISGFRGEIRNPTMLRARIELDIQYITEWSIWMDVQIVIKTFSQMIFPPKSAV